MSDLKAHYPVIARVKKGAHVSSKDAYQKLYDQSVKNPDKFWGTMAKKFLTWNTEFPLHRTDIADALRALLEDRRADQSTDRCPNERHCRNSQSDRAEQQRRPNSNRRHDQRHLQAGW